MSSIFFIISWGAGHFGQLAVGNSREEDQQQYTFTSTPVVVERLLPHMVGSPCKSVAAGDWHALALTESGRVWAWGSNRSFQCGRKPSIKSTHAPTLTVPFPVPMEEQVVQISAGKSHSAAIVQGYVAI
jgi:alpha-tubulin suppressor-like RCC1 family protein